jgi:hypothetical protein
MERLFERIQNIEDEKTLDWIAVKSAPKRSAAAARAPSKRKRRA